jgi:hypothetical protein
MEPDISILRKTGHFYFALTPNAKNVSLQNENVRFEQSRNVRFHRWPRALWKRSELP